MKPIVIFKRGRCIFNLDILSKIFLLIALIGLSSFFSASETALTSFNNNDLEKLKKNKSKSTELLKRWLKNPNEMLTGMLLGNNVVNILASSIATAITFGIMGSSGKAIATVTGLMTIIILIFGEITPKIMAKSFSGKVAAFVILPIYFICFITSPVIKVLIIISKTVGRLFGVNIRDESVMITAEDIISFVNIGKEEGIIQEDKKKMIHSVFKLGKTTAREVMTPRTAMFTLKEGEKVYEVWDEIRKRNFSRIPVYSRKGIDNIIGVLYLKDLLNIIKNERTDLPIDHSLREVYFIPETKPIMKVLEEFKKRKIHMAIVVDEYGGTSGILTMEDLIEEIIGDIHDEYEEEEIVPIKEIKDGIYEVDARIDIESLNRELNIGLMTSGAYESLGGLIVSELKRIATPDDCIEVCGLKIVITEVDRAKIFKVLLYRKGDGVNI